MVEIREIHVYNREEAKSRKRINGAKIYVGTNLTGGNYAGAEYVATLNDGSRLKSYTDLKIKGSSVAIKGGSDSADGFLSLAEVEVLVPFLRPEGQSRWILKI